MKNNLGFSGKFYVECYGPDGKLKWKDEIENTIMNVALNDILDVYFFSGVATANFFVALIRDDNFTGIVAADTAASHAGWEESGEYSEANRPAWVIIAPASQNVTNVASPAEFNINATQIFKGAALFTDNTKEGTTGTLISAGLFTSGDKATISGDLIRISYEIDATG